MLYTPSSDDNTLFKRRLRNILSEKVSRNSRWPKYIRERPRSFPNHVIQIPDNLHNFTEANRETIFAIPFYEKTEGFEVKELKIILIYGKDLLYCRNNQENDNILFENQHWKVRDKEIRAFAEFLFNNTNENDRYRIRKFWMTLLVPE